MEKLSTDEIIKLVDILIGEVEAVGESQEDENRLKNLNALIDLTDACLDKISYAANASTRQEYSMRKIGREALKYLAEYHDPEICPYKEYKGKPYFSIKYIEDGQEYVGYGTYSPKVLSQYLRKYFMPSAQSEVVRCKDCKHRYIKDLVWDCPFGLSGGENFFCGYGSLERAERRTDERSD